MASAHASSVGHSLACSGPTVPADQNTNAPVTPQWYPEVSHFCDSVPLILVATKTDLRHDKTAQELLKAQGRRPLSSEDGRAVAQRIGAARYVEVCALNNKGVDDVFRAALEEAMGVGSSKRSAGAGPGSGARAKKSKAKCTIL